MNEVVSIEKSELQKLIDAAIVKAETVRFGYQIRKWFTKSEVADMFGYSITWVNMKIEEGVFEVSKRKGSVTMISKRSIENYR